LRRQLPDSSIAIFYSAPERVRSNDVNYEYKQDPDFYYLTGLNVKDAVLLVLKNKVTIQDVTFDEALFIPVRDKDREIWTGRMAGLEDAVKISGIENCFLTDNLPSLQLNDSMFSKVCFDRIPKGMIDDRNDTLDLFNLIDILKKKFNFDVNRNNYDVISILSIMREVKLKEELTLMRKAIDITCEGDKEMMRKTKPGMTEYEVQAIGEFVFKSGGSEYPGYPSICGSGENGTILHYETNRRITKNGDLILLDMGAEYHGYSADVTRTFPVNGKFTPEQLQIYNLVLAAHDSAMSLCKPGSTFQTPHKAAVAIISAGLLKLGIIEKESEYRKYFAHGTSHYLGLDVHDAGTHTMLKEGNVITIEPGIYIPPDSKCDPKWWNIGIRIEDDVLITSTGYENLSIAAPLKANEIETLMRK
jgi:Xaa-Pro aminopeptidase